MKSLRDRFPSLFVLLFAVICLWCTANIHWGKDHWHSVLQADAKGYFAYLPAVFIYQDLNYGFFDEIELDKYKHRNQYIDYREDVNGRKTNKFYCGTALVLVPFFGAAHLHTKMLDLPADGFSKWYRLWVTIGAVFYLFLGLWWMERWLAALKLGPWARTLALLAGVFGTNLFYYSVGEPGISHVFSFAFVALFGWQATRYFQMPDRKHIPVMAFALAIIVLLRPINGMVILATPLLAGNWQNWYRGLLDLGRFGRSTIGAVVLALALLSIQLIIYRISAGQWLVYSYTEEGFNFDKPQVFNFLFSYKKGFFLYTPMAALALVGWLFWWKTDRYRAITWGAFIAVVIYLLSSWWNWWYGGSFSARPMVEFLPFFIWLIAVVWQHLSKQWQRWVWALLVVVTLGFTQFQTFQYRYELIHWDSMDQEKYWEIFGQLP